MVSGIFAGPSLLHADEVDAQRAQVRALGMLTTAPVMTEVTGPPVEGSLRRIYFDALPWKGKPTKVFAWLGFPEDRAGKVPGVVLVHGGGGTAFNEWVTRWNEHGFAAISIAVEGQTDERAPLEPGQKRAGWMPHEWAGPPRIGIYQDSDEELADQWMYHAVADTVLANSLMRSLPEVDENRVGLMGISWGGVITSTVIGLDDRFAFAIPVYGCGHLSDAANQYGDSLGDNELYRKVWDPVLRLDQATLPVLWFSWPQDKHFPLDCQAASYHAAAGPRMVSLIPNLGHGHGPPWNRPDSYAFAESVVRNGGPWCRQTESVALDGMYRVAFSSERPLEKAVLVSTIDTGITGERSWVETSADLSRQGDGWQITAELPTGTTAWFVNAKSGELTVSSEFNEPTMAKLSPTSYPCAIDHDTQTTVLAGCALLGCRAAQGLEDTGSVLDLFSDTGARPVAGESRCSFSYTPSGSDWVSGVDEEQVFLASVQGDGWRLGIGQGGQIYSLRGPFGESVAPQRVTSPWNDEVWQVVVTQGELIGPIHRYQNANPSQRTTTGPLMYFIHQSGIYVQAKGTDGGRVTEPFYSPCLRKRWNPETRTLELVNWMQQAHTPCVWKSGVLIYTAYRDLGDGLVEVNQVLHNFGTERLGYLNAPWGGVRQSNLPHAVISNPDGSWEKAEGEWNWTGIPTRNLIDTGGWEAWVQDLEDESSPALALVFGTDREDNSNGKRENGAIRWGRAGNAARDYQVTERSSRITVSPGDSISIRWYLASGDFATVRKRAASVSDRAGVSRISFDPTIRQRVWLNDEEVVTDGEGAPWIELCAFPVEGTVPIFLLKDRRTGRQTITADPYALADTEPFPNPLPKELEIHDLYNNRTIYNQHRPHIGYENLLGYAFVEPPTGPEVQRIPAPAGIDLHSSAAAVWIPHTQPQD